MAVGHSVDVDAEDAVAEIVGQCRERLGGVEPRAGMLFCGYDADHAAVLEGVNEAFPGIELVGSTSVGELSSALGYQEDSVTLALFASDNVDITSGVARDISGDVVAAARQAVEEARAKTNRESRLCLTMPSVMSDVPSFLDALRTELGPGVPIIGGGSTTRSVLEFGPSIQFAGHQELADAAPILLFCGPLAYSFGIHAGWTPVGPRGRATKVGPGIVYEIDGKPALQFYERYLGEGIDPAFANPLAVHDPASGRFYLRAPRIHDREAGAIGVAGDVPGGAEVQLTIASTDEIFGGTKAALSDAIERFPRGQTPDAAVVFSCAVRKHLLGTRTGHEFDIMRSLLGDAVPMCGFYSFGEIAPFDSSGAVKIHNETIVALLLGAA